MAAAVVLVGDLQAELDGIITAQEADPPDDEHDVEGASVGFERARVTALLESAKAGLAALEDAADRVTRGTFGHCEVCGRAIGEERLAAMPAAKRCVGCATAPQRRF
ncbi:MAG: TraR/DksA C4-type zinc finger protein [Actinomycetota bacterium]|nr:TraR/DksA C4-type zinc finger protein [Actinomycetota bacterium]